MQTILREYAFNLDYARLLVADVADADMARSGGVGLENHAAFTIGHLVTGSAIATETLGLTRDLPAGWAELFERAGPSDRRTPPEDADYPAKDELLAELARQHDRVARAIEKATVAELDAPYEWRLAKWMPTLRDLLTFLCTAHESMHLGQLSAWRRGMGLPGALAR